MNRNAIGILGLLIGALVLLIPVLVAPLPPLGDYPNHLARMWLLSSGAAQASMAQFYHVQFDTFTNIAIDLIALTVGKLAGYQVAGRLSIGLAVVLSPLGGACLWWSVHRRVHWWMLSFGLLAWGGIMIDGFLNFQIAIGLALLFAAFEPAIVPRGWLAQVVIRAVLSVILLLAHPFGLLLYAMILGALAIGPQLALREWQAMLRRVAPAAISVLIVAILFVVFVPSLPGAQEHAGLSTMPAEFKIGLAEFRRTPVRKVFNLFFALRAYSNAIDGVTIMALFAPLALALVLRRLGAHAGLLLLSAALVVIYFVCPSSFIGAGSVDARFAVMMMFVFVVAVAPTLPRVSSALTACVLALFFVVRTGSIADIWQARQADIASLADALEPIPAGASLVTFEQRPVDRKTAPRGRYTSGGENSFRHLPALAIPWQHAFVPTLFSARGKQPVITLPPWDDVSEPNAGILNDVHTLDAVAPQEPDFQTVRYMRNWQKFDYLLVLNANMPDLSGPFVPPANLTVVRDAGFAVLYKIAH